MSTQYDKKSEKCKSKSWKFRTLSHNKLRNKCFKLRLSSQHKYFEQRCDGGPKNQHFWPTVKPFITYKCKSNKDIILCENNNIIYDPNEVANIFNNYFTAMADGIGFNDPIPSGYDKIMIAKYDDHSSILAIKSRCPRVIPIHSLMSWSMRHIIP